jgi:hypothetical protein
MTNGPTNRIATGEKPSEASAKALAGERRGRVQVAPYQDEQLDEVFALYTEVFGADAADAFRRRWRWSQVENLYPGETRRWVLTSQGQVVGFLATVPQEYLIGGRRVIAHTPSDYMVHPSCRFHGISLMRTFFRECPGCVTAEDIGVTIEVTKFLGARRVGRLERFMKPLSGRALPDSRPWRLLPMPLRHAIVGAKDVWDRLRRGRADADYRIEQVGAFDGRFDDFFQRLAASVPATLVRDARFLRWRYGPDSPQGDSRAAVARSDGDGLLGYVIYYLSREPSRTGYVMDLQTLPPDNVEAASALLDHAVKALRKAGAWKVSIRHLESPYVMPRRVLLRHGFLPRGGHELFVRLKDESLTETAYTGTNWDLSYGDMEASHAV